VTGPKKGFYADPDADIPYSECGWNHSVAEVVTVLLAEGLVLTRLDEGDRIPWQAFDTMAKEGEYWRLPAGTPRVPLSLMIEVRRAG
jgi:hypothetical protein